MDVVMDRWWMDVARRQEVRLTKVVECGSGRKHRRNRRLSCQNKPHMPTSCVFGRVFNVIAAQNFNGWAYGQKG